MSGVPNQRMNRLSFSNQFQSNEEDDDGIHYDEQQEQNFYNDDYQQQYQPESYFNQASIKQNQHYLQYNDQEDENEQDQNEYFRYNNFDLFVAKKSENYQKQPLQASEHTLSYNQNKQNHARSKSPSITQLPDFLRNQAERSSSYIKRDNEQNYSKQQRQNERCQHLYELGEKKRQELAQKKRESEMVKENDSQCTFRPQLFTKKSIYRAQTQSSLNIFERTNIWNEQKKQKLDQIKEADKNKDIEGCTFQPKIKTSQQSHLVNMSIYPNQNGIGLKGVDKFLRRQILARRAKEELEAQKENPFCHVENKNISKNIDQISISTLTKRNKQQEYVQPQQDGQHFDQAIKNLRWQLHNIEI